MAPDTPGTTVLQARRCIKDSAIRSARRATTAPALCAGRAARSTTVTSAPSAGSLTQRRGAPTACRMRGSPAPSARMDAEAEPSQSAGLVTMQKASAIQSAALASVEWDQSAGARALQVPPHVALYARHRVNHVPLTSQRRPSASSRLPSPSGH